MDPVNSSWTNCAYLKTRNIQRGCYIKIPSVLTIPNKLTRAQICTTGAERANLAVRTACQDYYEAVFIWTWQAGLWNPAPHELAGEDALGGKRKREDEKCGDNWDYCWIQMTKWWALPLPEMSGGIWTVQRRLISARCSPEPSQNFCLHLRLRCLY